jgi:H+/Cl- antiporter ClcA/CBS domain-containing protein
MPSPVSSAAAPTSGSSRSPHHLGDFTATHRLLPISLLAIVIGAFGAVVAAALLKLIALFTNLFFFQRASFAASSPANHHLGLWVIAIPVMGALIIGLMARYGSDRIRGHGIPEAIESILIHGSRVDPKIALLKPISAAVSIGSGGPFGSEGPIIMTGGAFGSLIAQFFHLTSAERKTLLVAGAAAGMSAMFAAPVASVMLGVEVLLFELKPRSAIPVALASVMAAAIRPYLLGTGPIFPVPVHPAAIGGWSLAACLIVGLLAGVMSAALTTAVYASEDLFERLPMHWMWWPAIGGLAIGIGGWFFPQALGVGYDVIGGLLQGTEPLKIIAGVLIVKSLIWAISLGSGTSGGVLAPLLMMGAALGGLEAHWLPNEGLGFWPLISMGAILGGTMRAPITGVIFAVELTHDLNVILPLLLAVMVAHGFTVLLLKRSILTEKISRRGFHLSREYAIDPLEIIFVREVMRTSVVALPSDVTFDAAHAVLERSVRDNKPQRLFPVVDADRHLLGVVTRRDLRRWIQQPDGRTRPLAQDVRPHPVLAHDDEPLRAVVYRMAETGLTRMPVVNRAGTLVGIVGLADLLTARGRTLEAEQRRERVFTRLRLKSVFGRGEEKPQEAVGAGR